MYVTASHSIRWRSEVCLSFAYQLSNHETIQNDWPVKPLCFARYRQLYISYNRTAVYPVAFPIL